MIFLNVLLDIIPSPGDLLPGGLGAFVKENFNTEEGRDIIDTLIPLGVIFASTTETFKIILRKNIGKKALSLPSILAGSTVYLGYSIVSAVAAYSIIKFNFHIANPILSFYLNHFVLIGASLIYLFFAFWVLLDGMDEFFHAKAKNAQTAELLEYRGDSIFMEEKLKANWLKENIWRIAEPKACFTFSFVISIFFPIVGFPILLSSLSFWLNEWYQVYYKKEMMKDAAINGKIEAQKANQIYNLTNQSETVSRVTTD